MNRLKILALSFLGGCLLTSGLKSQPLFPRGILIDFHSSEGANLLLDSESRQDYFPLSIQFVTQENLAYCGVASMVMVLNALDIPAPEAREFRTTHFTQKNIFNAQAEEIISAEEVSRRGMTLEQLAGLLESHPVDAQIYHGENVTLEEFRNLVVSNLQQDNNFVLVNYLGRAIGQDRGGHISPIAAYHQQSDRFLILDVARYRYPPVWVKARELWAAIREVDSVSGKTRGFVLIEPKN